MKKNKKIVLIILIIAIIGAILVAQKLLSKKGSITGKLQDNENTGLNIGNQAPDFILQSVDGSNVQLSSFRGKKAVVVNFWATWCPPCREEMPTFERIYTEHKDKVEILGVNLQESGRAVNNFLKAVPVAYPLLLDPNGDVKKAYNVFTQPVAYFIDKKGIIMDKKFGPLAKKEIEEKFAMIGVN